MVLILDNASHYVASILLLYRVIMQTLKRKMYYSFYPYNICYSTADDGSEHKMFITLASSTDINTNDTNIC